MDQSKTIWIVQNNFEPVEGQGICVDHQSKHRTWTYAVARRTKASFIFLVLPTPENIKLNQKRNNRKQKYSIQKELFKNF